MAAVVLYLGTNRAEPNTPAMDYARDIQPLFDRYCVACHACFDAPCQLNLGSYAGLARGASKALTYDGTRLKEVAPLRLFMDASSTTQWRNKGFYPVLKANEPAESTLMKFLRLKAAHPLSPTKPLAEDLEVGISRKNLCATPDNAADVVESNADLGMPFAFPGMTATELSLIDRWLQAGAKAPPSEPRIPSGDGRRIEQWERWLNGATPERRLLARWLFEHWAYAHLYFDGGNSGVFYRLVRSHTPPGSQVQEIATRRPNDDPGDTFYYRFRQIEETLVYKTHITFALGDGILQRIDSLFGSFEVAKLPGYSAAERSNPFETFAALPASARYQFMLDHAEYFVRTFIRGPVCRGQLATDVIRDHFWVLFQEPDKDPYIVDGTFRQAATPLLGLPGIEDDFLRGASHWFDSKEDRNRYVDLRQAAMRKIFPHGVDLGLVWDGDGSRQDAMLSIFRHHDSATVKAGWLGQYPLTTWLLDYPLFERSYYNLVVNFDVFGNLAHQAQTRLYFDLIRNGAEQNFLSLLPPESRREILGSWYQGSGKLKLWVSYEPVDVDVPSKVQLGDRDPYAELLGILLKRFTSINATPDLINRPLPGKGSNEEVMLAKLSGRRAQYLPVVSNMSEATILLLEREDRPTSIYTIVRNRRHSNVAFILGEDMRYQPELDDLTLVPGVATGYPNMMLYVPAGALETFVDDMQDNKLGDVAEFRQRILARWGISRRDPGFWDKFHLTTGYLRDHTPVEAGVLDLNRYEKY